MDRKEFEFHMRLATRGLVTGIFLFISAVTMLLISHPSAKGYIFGGIWLTLITFGIYKAIQVLRIGRRMEATGQVHDHNSN